MKKVIVFCISLAALSLFAQKKEKLKVFLLPTSHSWDSLGFNYDFDKVFKQVLDFKPELIFTEYANPQFEKQVTTYWNKDFMIQTQGNMAKTKRYENVEVDIKQLEQKVKLKPNDIQFRANLMHAYWYNWDRGNGNFQGYYLLKLLAAKKATKNDTILINQLFGNIDSLVAWRIIRGPLNEYSRICFPLAEKLGISYLDGMDSQLHDSLWSVYWEQSDKAFDEWKASVCKDSTDSNCKKYMTVRTEYLKRKADNDKEKEKYDYASIHQLFASSAYDSTCYWGDFKTKLYYSLAAYPKQLFEKKYEQWYKRNLDMCTNIADGMKKKGKSKSFVIVGASHGYLMKDLLANKFNIEVVLIK